MIRLVTLVKKMNFWSGSQWIVIWRKKYRQEPDDFPYGFVTYSNLILTESQQQMLVYSFILVQHFLKKNELFRQTNELYLMKRSHITHIILLRIIWSGLMVSCFAKTGIHIFARFSSWKMSKTWKLIKFLI